MGALRLAGAMGCALAFAACATASAPRTTREDGVALAPPAPQPTPLARWFQVPRRPVVGPKDARGDSIALLGGRRAILLASGAVRLERPETARRLDDAVLVPTSDGPLLVGTSGASLLAFPDPLGDARSLGEVGPRSQIAGAAPGAIFVREGGVRLLDAATGRERPTETFAPLEPAEVAFVDERRGAADFEIGRFVTHDGGRTWKHAGPWGEAGPLAALGGGVVLLRAAGPDALDGLAPERGGPPTREFLVSIGEDPLVAAVERGIPGAHETAYVAHRGELAHVDLRTGAVLRALPLLDDPSTDCGVSWRGEGVLQATCARPWRYGRSGTHVTVDTRGGGMRVVSRQDLGARGHVETSRDGGVLLTWGCSGHERDRAQVCVLQPDQSFASFPFDRKGDALPRPDGSVLAVEPVAGAVVVSTLAATGRTEVARAPIDEKVVDVTIVEGPERPSIAVSTPRGTRLGELRGNTLTLALELDCVYAASRGGAFACAGPNARTVVRGPDERSFRELPASTPPPLEVSPVGLRTGAWVHVGLDDLTDPPRAPAAEEDERELPLAKLTCQTPPGAAAAKPLREQVTGPDASGWIVDDRESRVAALKVERSGPRVRWLLRWYAPGTQAGVLQARLDAPTDRVPTIDEMAIHRGTLALAVETEEGRYVLVASTGGATAMRVSADVRSLHPGGDGTVAWVADDGLFVATPGKPPEKATSSYVPSLSEPSAGGLWFLARTGSVAWAPGGAVELTPRSFRREPSLRALDLAGAGRRLAPCAKGARGRSVELPAQYFIQLDVDGAEQRVAHGRVQVLMDRPEPCLAFARTGTILGGRQWIEVDFLDGRSRWTTGRGITDVECSWGPPTTR